MYQESSMMKKNIKKYFFIFKPNGIFVIVEIRKEKIFKLYLIKKIFNYVKSNRNRCR